MALYKLSIFFIPSSFLLYGFFVGMFNQPLDEIHKFYNISSQRNHLLTSDMDVNIHWAMVVTSASIGSIFSQFVVSFLMDRYGRKLALTFTTVFGILSLGTAVFAVTNIFYSPDLLIFCNVIFGLYVGSHLTIAPVYLAELVPKNVRGKLGAMFQINLIFGFILALVLSLPQTFGGFENWFVLFVAALLMVLFQIVFISLAPESPRYIFITCNDEIKCREILKQSGRRDSDINLLIEEMNEEKRSFSEERISLWRLLHTRSQWKPLLLGCTCSWMAETCGSSPVLYYSNIVFTNAGLPTNISNYSTLGLAIIMNIPVLINLVLVDRYGRRPLLLTGLGGMVISYVTLTMGLVHTSDGNWGNILAVIGVMLSVCFALVGPLSVLGFISAELFTQSYRASGLGLVNIVQRLGTVTSLFTFPLLNEYLGSYIFLVYTGLCFLYWVFVYFFIPETKNRTFLQISAAIQGTGE